MSCCDNREPVGGLGRVVVCDEVRLTINNALCVVEGVEKIMAEV